MSIRCAESMPAAGQIALISQSGVLCGSLIDRAKQQSIGLSHVVSVDDVCGATLVDWIDDFAADAETAAIGVCLDSIADVEALIAAARDCCGHKPIVVYRPRTFESSSRGLSRDGDGVDSDRMDDALFRKCGMVRVDTLDDVVDAAAFLGCQPIVAGPRVAILSNAMGLRSIAIEAMKERRSVLAPLAANTTESLCHLSPTDSPSGGWFDDVGTVASQHFADALDLVLQDDNTDVVLGLWSSQATDASDSLLYWIERCRNSSKLILVAALGGAEVAAVERLLKVAGIASFRSPRQAILSLDYLLQQQCNRARLEPVECGGVVRADCNAQIVRQTLDDAIHDSIETMAEDASKRVLSAYGIPVAESLRAGSVDEAVACAEVLRYPVVLKIVSPQIAHKTDVGGVALHLHDESEVRAAFCGLMRSARQHAPDAIVPGVTVQPMFDSRDAFELILGGFRDPTLGPTLMLRTGGIAGDALHDTVFELPPWNVPVARQMIRSLKIWPLMQGVRNHAAIDIDSLVDVLLRTAQMMIDCPQIRQLTMNPLLVSPHGAVALDARICVRHAA